MICIFPFYFPYLYVNLSIVNSVKSVTFFVLGVLLSVFAAKEMMT